MSKLEKIIEKLFDKLDKIGWYIVVLTIGMLFGYFWCWMSIH